jgi:5-hydroxyisourate hydrolase
MRIFTHVLDGTHGKPALGMHALLARHGENGWTAVADAETDYNGRIEEWADWYLERGLYRIVFDSDGYFASQGVAAAYSEVGVIFRVQGGGQYLRVQVTISPYSYSTYFGTLDNPADRQ